MSAYLLVFAPLSRGGNVILKSDFHPSHRSAECFFSAFLADFCVDLYFFFSSSKWRQMLPAWVIYFLFLYNRGHKPDWYTKAFGHLCAAEVVKIRDSFLNHNPATKEVKSRWRQMPIDAAPQWTQMFSGMVWVSTHGMGCRVAVKFWPGWVWDAHSNVCGNAIPF